MTNSTMLYINKNELYSVFMEGNEKYGIHNGGYSYGRYGL